MKKSDVIQMVLSDIGISPDDAIYVGDTEFDYEGATVVGMSFVGVTYGFGYKKTSVLLSSMLTAPKIF